VNAAGDELAVAPSSMVVITVSTEAAEIVLD